jgi:uncharacterized protein
MSSSVVLFVKEPQAGKVKTRLQSHCSAEQAAVLYRAFLLDSAETLAASAATRKIIAYAPVDAENSLREILSPCGDFEYIAQPAGNLGDRLRKIVEWTFANGAAKTVVLGSDSPSMPIEYIDRALELLEGREVVVGPSTDGGYYLIGQRPSPHCLYSDIQWSTGVVLEETLARLGEQTLALLPPWYDVDTPQEAAFLRMHLLALRRTGLMVGRHSLPVLETMELPPPS